MLLTQPNAGMWLSSSKSRQLLNENNCQTRWAVQQSRSHLCIARHLDFHLAQGFNSVVATAQRRQSRSLVQPQTQLASAECV